MIVLRAGEAQAVLRDDAGGRVASLTVGDVELLVTGPADDPMGWGSFPMAPYAGRVRDARFEHDGVAVELPVALTPHAAHGLVYDRPWTRVDDGHDPSRCALAIELGHDWPFGGSVAQRFQLSEHALHCTLDVAAGDRSMPAEIGWHPWFRSQGPIELAATEMYEREGKLPTGRLVRPKPPPWDDCFLNAEPVRFPVGPLTVEVSSDCDHYVVFNELEQGIAVEPQSGPPDAFHLRPRVLSPHQRLERTMTIAWRSSLHTGR